MKINELELGYTPKNLKTLREGYGLTQKEVATIVGCKHYQQVNRWEAPISSHTHANMPHEKWLLFKNFLNINEGMLNMPIKILDLGMPNMRRIVSGSMVNALNLDYTKSLKDLQVDVQLAIDALRENQGFFKNLIMFRGREIFAYKGNNHIDIVANGIGSTNWLFIGDQYVGGSKEE